MSVADIVAVREPNGLHAEMLARRLACDDFEVARTGAWVIGHRAVSGERRNDARTFVAEAPMTVGGDASLERIAQSVVGGRLAELRGDVTLVHIDQSATAHAVSAVAGAVPLYYWQAGDRAALATRLGDLARHVLEDARIDVYATSLHLSAWTLPNDRSFLEGVSVLPPGHYLKLDERPHVSSYWSAEAIEAEPPTRVAFRRQSEALRYTLLRRIDELLPKTGILLTVSGGVDSSIIAALAGGVLGRRYSRLTYVMPPSSESDREHEFVRSVDDYVGSALERAWDVVLDPDSLLRWSREAPPALTPMVSPLLSLLPDLSQKASVRAHAGGEFADELFGSRTISDDWISSLSVEALVRRPSALPLAVRFSRGAIRTRFLRARGALPLSQSLDALDAMPKDLVDAHQSHVAEWQRRLAHSPRGALPLRLARAHALKCSYWEAMSPLGIVPVYPFLGRDILELALSIHPLQNASFIGKRVLRDSMKGLVPALNLARRDKGNYPGLPPSYAWSQSFPPELAQAVRPDWLENPPTRASVGVALHLQGLLNIVRALRNERLHSERLRKTQARS